MSAANWSEGYATGAPYLQSYFHDLNPGYAAFVLLLEGLEGPPPGPCCELGFGQGLSLALHAAGDPTRAWWGTDFMPEHAAQARELLAGAGVQAEVGDDSFEAFFARTDLPRFAFVGLHGVWSWVSPANRARIVAFLDRHLLPGGVVYLSHNTLAGWAALQPLRELLRLHLARSSGPGRPAVAGVSEAMGFLQQVLAAGPAVLTETPGLGRHVAELAQKQPEYLLHELLNEDWHPLSPAQVAAELQGARLTYAASSDLHNRMTPLHLTSAQQTLLAGIADPWLRESTNDVFTARRFRRGYWVRGPRRLSPAEARRRLESQRVVLAVAPAEIQTTASGPRAQSHLNRDHLKLVLDALQAGDAPVAIGALLERAQAHGIAAGGIIDLLAWLVGSRALLLAGSEEQVQAARPAAQRLNAHLVSSRGRPTEIEHLLSPVSGGGVPTSALLKLLLQVRAQAPEQPERWPGMLWDAMQVDGKQLRKGDKPVGTRSEAEAMLRPMVQTLLDQALPLLRRLGISG